MQQTSAAAQAGGSAVQADTQITLKGDVIAVEGEGVTVTGSTPTITAAGTYSVSGALNDGQIAVNAADDEDVTLILNGADIHNSSSAAINAVNAEDVILVLAKPLAWAAGRAKALRPTRATPGCTSTAATWWPIRAAMRWTPTAPSR